MADWVVETDVDDVTAHAAFATDRLWCGYAIADLEPPFRAYSQVAVARQGTAVAACLILRHPAFNSVVPHGPPEGLDAILEQIELPPLTHMFALEDHLAVVQRWVTYDDTMPMLRMVVNCASFRPPTGHATADRLGPGDVSALTDLYAAYPGNAFNPDQLGAGVFYGVRDGSRLLAAAGTHVVSARYSIAAVGSIFTRPEARDRGFATPTTGAVVADLLAAGCQDAILNVAQDNQPAQHVYAQLGFREHCRHYEGIASA